jgi:PEP-CTERM motif
MTMMSISNLSPNALPATRSRHHFARRLTGATFLALSALFATAPAQALPTRQVTLQPWQVCDDAGNNCATTGLFGAFTTKIWAQADIVVNFLSMQTVNSSARLNEDDFSDLGNVGSASIIDLWFVNDLTDCGGPVSGTLFGCGTTGGWFAVTQAVFDYSAVGRVDTLAHELGHVLGLGHSDFGAGGADNLMTAGSTRNIPQVLGDVNPDGLGLDKLTAAQIAEARSSDFTSPADVPEPGTLALAALALLGIGSIARKKTARH